MAYAIGYRQADELEEGAYPDQMYSLVEDGAADYLRTVGIGPVLEPYTATVVPWRLSKDSPEWLDYHLGPSWRMEG